MDRRTALLVTILLLIPVACTFVLPSATPTPTGDIIVPGEYQEFTRFWNMGDDYTCTGNGSKDVTLTFDDPTRTDEPINTAVFKMNEDGKVSWTLKGPPSRDFSFDDPAGNSVVFGSIREGDKIWIWTYVVNCGNGLEIVRDEVPLIGPAPQPTQVEALIPKGATGE